MCFLVQLLLFSGATGVACSIHVVLGAPYWTGGLGGILFFIAAWVGYLKYQCAHPDWWAPWDSGLHQVTRMVNAFFPAFAIFLAAVVLFPTFVEARQKALKRQQRQQIPRFEQQMPSSQEAGR